MRAFVAVIVIVLAIILIGGVVNVGGAPIFGRIDSLLGTHILMKAHNSVFFFLHRVKDTVGSEASSVKTKVKDFETKPLGIDNKSRYQQLDDAASN